MSRVAVSETCALVTGANSGIGKDISRQLALSGRYGSIVIGSRSKAKGRAACEDLKRITRQSVFEVLPLNLSSIAAVRGAVSLVPKPVDDLVMNAGGFGGHTPFEMTSDGVPEIIASNLLGHAVLLDGLLSRGILRRSAIFAGSEAARGVSQMGIKRPSIESGTIEEFVAVLDGSRFRRERSNPNAAYAWTKLLGALWMGHIGRAYPELKILTVSPGGTAGTAAADVYPQPARFLVKSVVMPWLLPLMGMGHRLEVGAKRLVNAVERDDFKQGAFYASWPKASGPVSDQAAYFPELADPKIQDNAAEAVKRFVERG